MKMAQGYVTNDGTFFESKVEAELHEAELILRHRIGELSPEIDQERLLLIVLSVRDEMRRYIDAYNTTNTAKYNKQVEDREEDGDGQPATTAASTGHVSSAEEDLASLLKLPARGSGHMPDVGSGSRPEEVQERRTEHGPRVRRGDASSVRRRKDMAVKQDTKA